MDHDAFLEQAWRDHADDAAGVADRIEGAIGAVEAPAHVAPFARLATHVFGEHLGEWQRGRELLARLRDAARGDDDAQRAIARGAAALAYAAGAPDPCRGLSDDDRIAALAAASSALAARDDHDRALVAYDEALRVAAGGLREGSPALRALAVGGNNLAASLEAKGTRSERESRGMVDAASAALVYWKRAGGWLEEERAEYRLAMSQLAAGDAFEAAEHARRCLDVCARHGAPPFERFFGTVALALAERALGDDASYRRLTGDARAIHASLADEERAMADADLASLDAR
jgi:hypothetical protein